MMDIKSTLPWLHNFDTLLVTHFLLPKIVALREKWSQCSVEQIDIEKSLLKDNLDFYLLIVIIFFMDEKTSQI